MKGEFTLCGINEVCLLSVLFRDFNFLFMDVVYSGFSFIFNITREQDVAP